MYGHPEMFGQRSDGWHISLVTLTFLNGCILNKTSLKYFRKFKVALNLTDRIF